jgi:NAD(P)-dependent dehydrogenase (short-subunit alcohol dehydrogenase family)
MRLKDKVVIVTGGGQGLGEAFAKGCAREGAKVVIVDVNEETGKKVEQEIGENAVFIRTDVSQRPQVQAMVDEVMKRFGRIDVLVNNAGVHAGGKFWEGGWFRKAPRAPSFGASPITIRICGTGPHATV